jgi:predicted RNA-binding Zn-ribbon protein involved in translation (DUF1610 family)
MNNLTEVRSLLAVLLKRYPDSYSAERSSEGWRLHSASGARNISPWLPVAKFRWWLDGYIDGRAAAEAETGTYSKCTSCGRLVLLQVENRAAVRCPTCGGEASPLGQVPQYPGPPCGHSECRQHWIDTASVECVRS